MAFTKSLDPNRYVLTVQGVPATQVAADTFFEFSMESDQVLDEVGGRGDVVRTINLDQRATVKVTLLQTSTFNDFLSALVANDLNALGPAGSGGYSVGASSLVDLNGTTEINAEESWVVKYADAGFGSKPNTRVWTIRFARATVKIGGNSL